MIPKTIHQIWFQGEDQMPEHLKMYHKSWVDNNPDYHIKVWDEVQIKKLIDSYPDAEVRNMYYGYPHMIQKIDLAKYVILYKYGGIYIDMDVKNLQRIDQSFFEHYDLIVSKMPESILFKSLLSLGGTSMFVDIINNGIIMTRMEHPVILDTINEAKKNNDSIYKNINKTLYVYVTTGPLCLTNAVYKNPSSKVKIINQSYFEGCDVFEVENKTCQPPENALGIHLYENKWVSSSENSIKRFIGFLIKNLFLVILSLIIFIILIYIIFKTKLLKNLNVFSRFKNK
jgi:inositol phosphorylceramide mannosyltransferase catalytic subunit